jgi:hypothetical protein
MSIDTLQKAGAIVVAAAGNENTVSVEVGSVGLLSQAGAGSSR